MRDQAPNPVIVDRAVALWIKALRNPRFDNGDASTAGGMATVMASLAAKPQSDEALNRFGDELRKRLLTPRDGGYYHSFFGCDYGPDSLLSEAAEAAGFEGSFPWKTDMSVRQDHVSFSQGYGAPHVCHYPLSGGRWLVTRLRGEDMPLVIAAVEAGAEGFTVEPAA